MTADAPGTRCAVCLAMEPDAARISVCYDCGEPFHLNPYSNREGIDCGDAVLGENQGLYLFCRRCLEAEEAAAARPADADPGRARAEAMMAALHGAALPPPVPPPAAPPPATGIRAARRTRRRYRRIDADPS